MKNSALFASVFFVMATFANAEQTVSQPYIDELKDAYDLKSGDVEPEGAHLEELKKKAEKLQNDDGPHGQSHIDKLKAEHGIESKPPQTEGTPHIDELLQKAGGKSQESRDGQAHIDALKSGKKLEEKKTGVVQNAAGVTVSVGGTLDIQANNSQANSFESIYRPEKKYNPTVDAYFERHILRHRIWGALGPLARIGVVSAQGTGRFTRSGGETDVKFRIFAVPLSAGVSYRAIQLRFFQPYAQAAAMMIPFLESRDDGGKTKRGMAYTYSMTVGAGISIDWIGRRDAWNRYDEYGILHTYLVVQQQFVRPMTGRIDFKSSTTMAGLNFEF